MKSYQVLLNNPTYGKVVVAADSYKMGADPSGGNSTVSFFQGAELVAWFSGVIGILASPNSVPVKAAPQ